MSDGRRPFRSRRAPTAVFGFRFSKIPPPPPDRTGTRAPEHDSGSARRGERPRTARFARIDLPTAITARTCSAETDARSGQNSRSHDPARPRGELGRMRPVPRYVLYYTMIIKIKKIKCSRDNEDDCVRDRKHGLTVACITRRRQKRRGTHFSRC